MIKIQIDIPEQFRIAFITFLEEGNTYLTQHMDLDEGLDCEGFNEFYEELMKKLKEKK